jgi:hypothetical protein
MLNKACNLLNCKPKFGRQAWDDGKEVVTFCPIPRDPKQWTDKPERKEDEKPELPTADETNDAEKNEATANASDADRPEGQKRTDPAAFMKNHD